MRVAELSRRSGVPVPTIKYYLREGLLQPGELTSPNQARYGDEHVRRLKLVRALLDVGGLSVAAVRDVLETMANPGKSMFKVLGTVQHNLAGHVPAAEGEHHETASRIAHELVERHGWQIKPNSPPLDSLIASLGTLIELHGEDLLELLDAYADASQRIAAFDIDYTRRGTDRGDAVERMVIGTVVGDAILSALRRLAHENEAARRLHSG
ncbi:MerR family transcriptional regulator [Amycolatopsis sp. 195334CR]|uniref:MerR family transcriptional regulator n=1 Tax=Amycolatopsis sp. 195334CR TaxID=2814588 RepID=UPI001A8EF164|nr:MerR family transcriptional regulator [Amycolatopsis sp. 195334CR]MBN6036937.1 MerR family transcriptional regulator [Amycolatopsis sp. 195334CR]